MIPDGTTVGFTINDKSFFSFATGTPSVDLGGTTPTSNIGQVPFRYLDVLYDYAGSIAVADVGTSCPQTAVTCRPGEAVGSMGACGYLGAGYTPYPASGSDPASCCPSTDVCGAGGCCPPGFAACGIADACPSGDTCAPSSSGDTCCATGQTCATASNCPPL